VLQRLTDLVRRVKNALAHGEKLYWVCPLIKESENIDLTAASKLVEFLGQHFGTAVSLMHGQMSAAHKAMVIANVKKGTTRLLFATTVLEVGVDMPDASIIIIEHAERFGLMQLHQLRGRVGRSNKPSFCILLYKEPLSKIAAARLDLMRKSENGLRIAEDDLRLRGEGELLGTKQSGVPDFRFANMEAHQDLLKIARHDAIFFFRMTKS